MPHLIAWAQHAIAQLDSAASGGRGDSMPAVLRNHEMARLVLVPAALRVMSSLTRELNEAGGAQHHQHLDELLSVLLTPLAEAGATAPTPVQMDTMEAALECLDAARLWPPYQLLPHKQRVLKALKAALDHRKRRIRQAACRCGYNWHLLGGK